MKWPRTCPVCLAELPETGNRRVYVPWKRGYRLVHAGECFDAIDAQQVLEATTVVNEKPRRVDPVLLVRCRARVQALLERYEPLEHTREELTAIARLRVARLDQPLVRDESPEQLERLCHHARQLVDRVLAHGREVSAPARTEAAEVAWW